MNDWFITVLSIIPLTPLPRVGGVLSLPILSIYFGGCYFFASQYFVILWANCPLHGYEHCSSVFVHLTILWSLPWNYNVQTKSQNPPVSTSSSFSSQLSYTWTSALPMFLFIHLIVQYSTNIVSYLKIYQAGKATQLCCVLFFIHPRNSNDSLITTNSVSLIIHAPWVAQIVFVLSLSNFT